MYGLGGTYDDVHNDVADKPRFILRLKKSH